MNAPDLSLLQAATALPAMTKAHYSRLRFYWVNRGASNQGTALDLDLHVLGFIELASQQSKFHGQGYVVTDAGVRELAAQTERERQRRAPHHELAGRLAQWLQEQGRMTWEGVEFVVKELDVSARAKALDIDVSAEQGILYACPRPDVFSLVPTHNEDRLNTAVHEVKVSRADFLADVSKPLKRLAYACIAEVVYYAAPEGLIAPDELPKNCGLVVETKTGEFKVLKKAKRTKVKLTPWHYMNMVMKPGTWARPF